MLAASSSIMERRGTLAEWREDARDRSRLEALVEWRGRVVGGAIVYGYFLFQILCVRDQSIDMFLSSSEDGEWLRWLRERRKCWQGK